MKPRRTLIYLTHVQNNVAMQIVSSHVDSYEEMKEGNCSIHIGIVIWNAPSFEYQTQIDFLCF